MPQPLLIEAFGERRSIRAWADDHRCSVRSETIGWRLRKGWTAEDAISMGPGDAALLKPSFPAGSVLSNPNVVSYAGPKLTNEQETLVLDNVDKARRLAATMCRNESEFDELLSMAYLGLCRAALKSSKPQSFGSYAWFQMKNAVREGWEDRARWSVEVPSSDWLGATA